MANLVSISAARVADWGLDLLEIGVMGAIAGRGRQP